MRQNKEKEDLATQEASHHSTFLELGQMRKIKAGSCMSRLRAQVGIYLAKTTIKQNKLFNSTILSTILE